MRYFRSKNKKLNKNGINWDINFKDRYLQVRTMQNIDILIIIHIFLK